MNLKSLAFAAALSSASIAQAGTPSPAPKGVKNIVLVHGGFVDGSGWQKVYNRLKQDGYNVSVVQNPTTSLADDVAVTKRVIAQQDGPVVLVGHSYGGVVISEVGFPIMIAGYSVGQTASFFAMCIAAALSLMLFREAGR